MFRPKTSIIHCLRIVLLVCLLVGGCSVETWHTQIHSLTDSQLEEQHLLLIEWQLPARHNDLIGQQVCDYRQLFELANETHQKGDTTVFVFNTPGANDDGSAGRLEIQVFGNEIISSEHHSFEH